MLINKVRTATLQLFILVFLIACGGQESETMRSPSPADLILTNGKIFVADEAFSLVDTLVVTDGLIVATGNSSLTERFDADETVDLGGKLVIPGFNDSHTHIRGRPQRYIELSEVTSIEEIQLLIRAKIAEIGEGEWITGYGWSEDELDEGRRPLRLDLDAVSPNNPVILTRAGGHSAVTNSMALQLAEITLETPQPAGGVIEVGEDGMLNGIIRERQNLVGKLVPDSTYEEIIASLEVNLNALLAKGITSITDASKPSMTTRCSRTSTRITRWRCRDRHSSSSGMTLMPSMRSTHGSGRATTF